MYNKKPRYGIHIALIAICLILACPALYALQVATLTLDQSVDPRLFPPSDDFFTNINELFEFRNFDTIMLNTLIVSLVVLVGKTILSMLAGAAFVYFRFPGKWVLFFFILLTLLMPTELIILPLLNLVDTLAWTDQFPQLALTMPFIASAVGMFLFRQHFQNIPRELVEAAQIDGASPLRFLWSILMPMSWNVIGAHAIIQFILMWNQYIYPKLLFSGKDASYDYHMLQVRVSNTVSGDADFGLLMAAGVIASIPPLIFFLVLQKQFMSGFALTRDK